MVKELYCLQEAFPEVPLGEMIIWSGRNGAEFLSKEDILGTIAPGKRPGLVMIGSLSPEGRLTSESTSTRLV